MPNPTSHLRPALAAMALLAGAGCAAHPPARPTPPSPGAAENPPPVTPAATAATTPAAPAGGSARLSLAISTMEETTGKEFGLTVPMLLLRLRNDGPGEAQVPDLGIAMLLSIEVQLRSDRLAEQRHATLYRAWPVTLSGLLPGAVLQQGVSPLSQGQRDLALPLGSYQVKVCVPDEARAAYPSGFTKTYGGTCSNEVTIEVRRRKGR